MKVRYTFPISGDLYLPEQWPLEWNGLLLEWKLENDVAVEISISVRTNNLFAAPQVTQNPEPGVAAHINIGPQPRLNEIEQLLRSAVGYLNFFSTFTVDLDKPGISWEPENDEEEKKLQLLSFTVNKKRPAEPSLPVGYDLVARAFLGASVIDDYETPLSFIGKGRRDFIAGRFIDAYYSFYFFLETLFAPGYSNPKVVKAKFKSCPQIMEAIATVRRSPFPPRLTKRKEFFEKNDGQLIDLLVELRGELHHHALRKKDGKWHPDKHDEFELEASFLHGLTLEIAQRALSSKLFSEEITNEIIASAKKQNSLWLYVVTGKGRKRGTGNIIALPQLNISIPGSGFTHGGADIVLEQLHRSGDNTPYKDYEVLEYNVSSDDGQLIARYYNHAMRLDD